MDGTGACEPAPYVVQAASTKAPGGIETAVRHYHRMLVANGVRTACLYRGPAADLLRSEGIDVIALPAITTGMLRGLPLRERSLRREVLARGRPSMVVVHSDLLLPAVRRICDGAVLAVPCHSDKVRRKRGADLAITLNAAQQVRISTALNGRVRVAELGNPYVPYLAEAGPAVPRGAPRVVFCARFTPIKEPLTFLRAIARMRMPVETLMIGTGPLQAEARALAQRLGLSVRFEGWLPDPWAEIGPPDVLVLPSSWEGLPYLLLEALDRGVGVVASDIAGNRAALGGGAFGDLFAVGDDEGLARLLDDAVADPVRLGARAAEGRDWVRGRFGAEAFWRRLSGAAPGALAPAGHRG